MQLVSPNRAVVGTQSGLLLLVDVCSGDVISIARAHSKAVNALAIAADGSFVVSGSSDGYARIWSAQTLQPVGEVPIDHATSLNGLAVSRCGRLMASAGYDGTIRVCNICTSMGSCETLTAHSGIALSVVFSADGSTLYSGGSEEICVWDVGNVEGGIRLVGKLEDERMRNVSSLPMSANGCEVIALALTNNYILTATYSTPLVL